MQAFYLHAINVTIQQIPQEICVCTKKEFIIKPEHTSVLSVILAHQKLDT